MAEQLCLRWKERKPAWAHGPYIDTSIHEVAAIPDDNTASAFVHTHHYLGTYPPARFRFGIYRRGQLAGVAVFGVPQRDAVVTSVFPCGPSSAVVLSRFVLFDEVEKDGETWFLGQCRRALRREGIEGVVAFSDPVAREVDGLVVMPGHVGTIYKAHSARYLGRSKAETKWLLPNGQTFHRRAMSKIKKGERGCGSAAARLQQFGAPAVDGDPSMWLATWLPRIARPVRHPGNHKYAWAVNNRMWRHMPPSRDYPAQED